MAAATFTTGAAGVVLIALVLSWSSLLFPSATAYDPPVVGLNNTALFLVNSEYGLTNVHFATAHALLERHPHIQLHFASFPKSESRIKRINSFSKNPDKKDIAFHRFEGLSYIDAILDGGWTPTDAVHPPGLPGISQMCEEVQLFISPWDGEGHLALYEQVGRIIDAVNPAVVVLDTLLRPAVDATRQKNRLHAIISPNTLIDNFPGAQPCGGMFWKYPTFGSGIPYPVPWWRIPENILLSVRWISTVTRMPEIREKKAFLKSKGLSDPINFMRMHRPHAPWVSQTMLGASVPVDFVPENVTCAGPMSLSLSTVAEQDKGLASWLTKAPTVLINLGSLFPYREETATIMTQAISKVLQDSDVQVLWKFLKKGDYDDRFMEPLLPFVKSGRVKVEKWLAADPPTLLESSHVVASVHHGGAGCYHEAIGSGVPQVVLPQWLDLYNYAQLVEYIGVGVWGCPKTRPVWTSECLSEAILAVVNGNQSQAFRNKAKELGQIAQANPGRYTSAQVIANLAGSGI